MYLCAIAGALSAFLILGQLFGENWFAEIRCGRSWLVRTDAVVAVGFGGYGLRLGISCR